MKLLSRNMIVFGGLTEEKEINTLLRRQQIEDGHLLHTCNDYDASLEVISKASSLTTKKPRIMLKVYYAYPDYKNRRFRPIKQQIEEALKRLNCDLEEIVLQCCCFFPQNILNGNEMSKFFLHLKIAYKIKRIFLEYYRIYNYSWQSLYDKNQKFDQKVIFGVAGYQNYYNRVLNKAELRKLQELALPFCYIGFLGKGKKDQKTIALLTDNNPEIEHVNMHQYLLGNIAYLIENARTCPGSIGITSVSSKTNYEQLLDLFDIILEKTVIERKKLIRQMIQSIPTNYFYEDYYGGKFIFRQMVRRPKLLLKYLLQSIMSKIMKPFSLGKFHETT